jgi:hypothetical protein
MRSDSVWTMVVRAFSCLLNGLRRVSISCRTQLVMWCSAALIGSGSAEGVRSSGSGTSSVPCPVRRCKSH